MPSKRSWPNSVSTRTVHSVSSNMATNSSAMLVKSQWQRSRTCRSPTSTRTKKWSRTTATCRATRSRRVSPSRQTSSVSCSLALVLPMRSSLSVKCRRMLMRDGSPFRSGSLSHPPTVKRSSWCWTSSRKPVTVRSTTTVKVNWVLISSASRRRRPLCFRSLPKSRTDSTSSWSQPNSVCVTVVARFAVCVRSCSATSLVSARSPSELCSSPTRSGSTNTTISGSIVLVTSLLRMRMVTSRSPRSSTSLAAGSSSTPAVCRLPTANVGLCRLLFRRADNLWDLESFDFLILETLRGFAKANPLFYKKNIPTIISNSFCGEYMLLYK